MARPRRPFPAGSGAMAKDLMNSCKDQATFRRLQAVYLAAENDLSNQEIAKVTSMSINTVRMLHVRARRDGVSSLLKQPKGGRYRQHLAPTAESEVLKQVLPEASNGGMVVVSHIKAALESAAGRTYHLHSVYRLLARHGWRKISPRRQHPSHDPAVAATFQKSGRISSRSFSKKPHNADAPGASTSRTKPASAASAIPAAAGRHQGSGRSSKPNTSANTPTSSLR